MDAVITKNYHCAPELVNFEVLCAINEPRVLGDLQLPCEMPCVVFDFNLVESRHIKLGQEVLQVLTTAFVVKVSENKNDGSRLRATVISPLIRGRCFVAE